MTSYREPDSYEPYFCDRKCEDCHLQLKLSDADEWVRLPTTPVEPPEPGAVVAEERQ